ncbi:MAG: urease accessory protein UreD [Deltaproteobacteria bacterium]|nr:urease accessory protein UreD [Deltaproteobacteria bacterium]
MGATESSLAVTRVDGRSVVTASHARSPLKLLAPRNHGHAAWVYQSSYGGGFVGADDISLAVNVEPGSTLFLSSQAASRAYAGSQARFSLRATVADDAALVFWPDPLSCFPGADFEQVLHFSLAANASLLAVDALSAGRVARGERWAFQKLATKLHIAVANVPALRESLLLTADAGLLSARLEGIDALATVVLAGPKLAPACAQLAKSINERGLQPLREATLVTASTWPWGMVLRLASPSVDALTHTLRELLQAHAHALLGDDPWARKW